MGYLHIRAYVDDLSARCGIRVAVKDFAGVTAKDPDAALALSVFCQHQSPYCLALKSNRRLWDRCQQNNRALFRRCAQAACFTGMCYAGYSELVIPVVAQGRVVAAVCAGGFELDAEESRARRARTARQYGLDAAALDDAYARSVRPAQVDLRAWTAACGVLADFCLLLYASLLRTGAIDPSGAPGGDYARLSTLTCAIEYIHAHFDQDVRLEDVARFCGCSQSHLSHLFGRHMPVTLSTFVNQIRVQRARPLLLGGMPVAAAAAACGFADPNYFASVFRNLTGETPSGYARRTQRERGEGV